MKITNTKKILNENFLIYGIIVANLNCHEMRVASLVALALPIIQLAQCLTPIPVDTLNCIHFTAILLLCIDV